MRSLLICLIFPLISISSSAETEGEKVGGPGELPSVEQCIPEGVKALGEPALFPFPRGLVAEVTASTTLAKVRTLEGLNHLHGGWEFEASRNFAMAMQADPRCLMAHWGMLLCVLAPNPETDTVRMAVAQRLLQLVSDGEGSDLERGYAYGMVKYLEEGPVAAAKGFDKVSQKFSGDMQAEIFRSLFGRSGYDEMGGITPDQAAAEERLLQLIAKEPENAVPLHAYLLIHAEAPDLRPTLELARKLCQLAPDYAPYFHVLGHYEWRSGEHSKAASAFGRAANLYSLWMKENKANAADCEGWVRAECYRAVALGSKGDFDNALASAKKLAVTKINVDRPFAGGTRQLMWEGKTLPARILMRRGLAGDSAAAIKSLPTTEELKPFFEKSLSYWWVDGLRIALEARRQLEENMPEQAAETIESLAFHQEVMAKKEDIAGAIGERSELIRALRSLQVLEAELRGRLALLGPAAGRGSAFNWFRAATDRQLPSRMLTAPPLLTPMATALGDYFLSLKKPAKAVAAYEEALVAFPNDVETLKGLAKAFADSDQPEKASEISRKISALAPE